MNGIQPLRFITRAILPLVYDESLSYYEFLCKVVDRLNIVITNSNTQRDAIKALNAELKDFEASTDAKFLEYQANVERLFDEVEAKLNLKEDVANKTQTISDSSTEAQYPSAKAVNEVIKALNTNLNNKEDTANKTQVITDSSTEAQYPSAKAVNEVIKALNTDLNNKENTANKTQTITDSSTETQYPSAKAVLEYVRAHAGGGADVVSFDFPFGQETVTYDTTDGITMTGQARLTDANGETNDIATTVSIPIKAGEGISIAAKADGTGGEVTNTKIIALGYSTPDQSIVSTINNADIAAKYDDYDNVISATYATKEELPVYKTMPDGAIYKINNKDISAKYDYDGNDISTTYATKTELPVYKTMPDGAVYKINNKDIAAKYDYDGNDIINTYATKTFVNNKAEAWTFTLDDGTTVTKNVLVN